MKSNMIIRIAIFYLFALLSNFLRKGLFGLNDLINNLPDWLSIVAIHLQSFGILLGALVALHLMKRKKKPQYTFLGTSKRYSLLIAAIPVILIIFFGFKNDSGINQNLFGLIAAISVLVYCYFEEIGWRGYLHDELQSIKQ